MRRSKAQKPDQTIAHKPAKPGLAARRASLQLLRAVLEERHQLSTQLGADGPLYRLDAADRARAQRLAITTLRELGRADHILAQFMEKLPPVAALNILRLAVVELCAEGEAPHGVVDCAVTLMRKNRKAGQMTGLANAVLRKVAEHGPAVWSKLPPSRLPGWLRRRLVHMFDEQTVQKIEVAHSLGAPLDITLRQPEHSARWAKTLDATVLPTGSLRISRPVQVSQLPGYAEGAWWVQDAAAALAARLLAVRPGEQVLDICAAPGGKTMQLAAAGADVTAVDSASERMDLLRQNLRRTGLSAQLQTKDARNLESGRLYDAILLDAPCSATGTIRRHPDLPYVKAAKDLHQVFTLQAELIDSACAALKAGGRMVYCTCSLLPEEGERQAKTAMERHGLRDITPDPVTAFGAPQEPSWFSRVGGLRLGPHLWPECGGMDGFFMIKLQKPE